LALNRDQWSPNHESGRGRARSGLEAAVRQEQMIGLIALSRQLKEKLLKTSRAGRTGCPAIKKVYSLGRV
jgi:hypothetical protein